MIYEGKIKIYAKDVDIIRDILQTIPDMFNEVDGSIEVEIVDIGFKET